MPAIASLKSVFYLHFPNPSPLISFSFWEISWKEVLTHCWMLRIKFLPSNIPSNSSKRIQPLLCSEMLIKYISIYWEYVNNMAKLTPSGCLVADVAAEKKKIWSCKDRITVQTWTVRCMNMGKLNHKDEMKGPQIVILGVSK